MRLGLNLQYWSGWPPEDIAAIAREAEAAGYDSVWCAEAYGSDALTPLAYIAHATERIKLGTAVAQIPARAPTATAMAAITLDHLSKGRFQLGVGVSGPQVSEGWYGQPYSKPLARTREYLSILRSAARRDSNVTAPGPHYPLPLRGGTGLGKPLRSSVRPLRPELPILLGAEGPKNVALAAELADGWLAFFFSPRQNDFYAAALAEGFARRGGKPSDFQVVATVPVVIDDDVDAAVDAVRPMIALYVGGMGSSSVNFHRDVFSRMGYETEARAIQAAYLAGRPRDAAALVTRAMVEDVALVGPRAKVREELDLWRQTVITTICVDGIPSKLNEVAELVYG